MSTAPHAALTHINTNTKILQMCIAEAKRALEGSLLHASKMEDKTYLHKRQAALIIVYTYNCDRITWK